MSFVYIEDHSVIEREYLDQLVKIREALDAQDLDQQEADTEFMRLRSFAWARIPEEYWHTQLPMTISRTAIPTVLKYIKSPHRAVKHGLGIILFSPGPVYKLQPVYLMASQLVGAFSCFIATYNELIFWLKSIREDELLKQELRDRFRSSFFFLVEIPEKDELTTSLRQELIGRLETRCRSQLPTIFTVNSTTQSMGDIFPSSFLGKLLLPFSAVNIPLVVEDLVPVDQLHIQKWKVLDD